MQGLSRAPAAGTPLQAVAVRRTGALRVSANSRAPLPAGNVVPLKRRKSSSASFPYSGQAAECGL
jgi:hypothetical protein